MNSAGTKRSASTEAEEYIQENEQIEYSTFDPNDTFEKKKRFQLPPKLVGPLTFEGDGSNLHKAVFPAQPSNLPGVYRLTPPEGAVVRLWTPLWPFTTYLETPVVDLIESIDSKCIFIFDPRNSESDSVFGNTIPYNLLHQPILQRYGLIVSRFPPPNPEVLSAPYIQDPQMVLGKLCNFYDYLGPCCVLVKNNEVVCTLMLRRDTDSDIETINEWAFL